MTLWKLARVTRQAAQLSSATRNPGRAVGFWRAFGKVWR
jgi:hypothetical protein